MNIKLPVVSLLCLWAAAPAAAHDFWIAPASYRPEVDAVLQVHLAVGDHGEGDLVMRQDERIVRFVAADREGLRDVVGRDGFEPAGYLRPRTAGPMVLGYESTPVTIELAGDKFEEYLAERGLDAPSRARALGGQSAAPGRERYSRCAKALLFARARDAESRAPVAEAADGSRLAGQVLGQTLELFCELDPRALVPAEGVELPLRLEFRGRPLEGAQVDLLELDLPLEKRLAGGGRVRARTDAEGRVRFELPRAGRWLASAVHMVPDTESRESDWRSWWAALTFEVPAATGVGYSR